MINKILVIGGIALAAILIIENMVIPNTAYFFIDNSSSAWFVAFASTVIGVAIGYGLAGLVRGNNNYDDDKDNLDF